MGGTAWRASTIALAAVLAMSLAAAGGAGTMASSDVETRIKAAFIYNFARFIEWPGRSGAGPVRIGILGHGELASPLEEVIRGKTANGRSIEVTHIGAATDMDCCEILVIEHSESKHVAEIVQSLAGKPVLTVCDGGNCVRDGVMVVFQIVEESVRFQINQQAAEHAGLKISSQLLKVAIPAEGRHQ
jgi:hypothetical protein